MMTLGCVHVYCPLGEWNFPEKVIHARGENSSLQFAEEKNDFFNAEFRVFTEEKEAQANFQTDFLWR